MKRTTQLPMNGTTHVHERGTWQLCHVRRLAFPLNRMLLKRGTGSGERGTGNGSLGTSCQRKPPQKSKMAVQNTRERKKKTKKGIRALVENRWGRNCKSDSHFMFTFWAGGVFFRYSTCFIYNMIRTLTLLLDYSVYFRPSLNPACLSPWMFFFPLRQTLGE